MTKPISTRAHSMLDHTWTSVATALAHERIGGAATARLLGRAATVARTSSMMTNYEGGMVRMLPMKAHLAADVALAAVLIASPWLLPKSERRFATVPVVLGIVGLIASLLTETHSQAGFNRRQASDPDLAERPHLRPHLE